jgi:hypothetical protein
MTPVAEVQVPGREGFWHLSPDGTRGLLRRYGEDGLLLVDLRTGRALPSSGGPLAGRFLADGRLLFADAEGEHVTLRLLSPEAVETLRVRLPGYRIRVGGQPAPDLLAVATRPIGHTEAKSWTSWLVDLRTGSVRKIGQDLLPTVDDPHEPGSLSARLFHRAYGDLLLLDPATGKLDPVLPRAGAD